MGKIVGCFLIVLLLAGVDGTGQSFRRNEKELLEQLIARGSKAADSSRLQQVCGAVAAGASRHLQPAVGAVRNVLYAGLVAKLREKENPQSVQLYNEALGLATGSDAGLLAWIYTNYGFYYYSFSKYEQALPWFMAAERLLNEFPADKSGILQVSEVYRKNAFFHGILGDDGKSINYLETALKYTPAASPDYGTILFALGAGYNKVGAISQASAFFQKTREAALAIKDEVRYAKALGELARIHKDKKEYDRAVPLLMEDIALSVKNNDERNTMYARLLLGAVYLEQDLLIPASAAFLEAAAYAGTRYYLKSFEYEALDGLLQIAVRNKEGGKELELRRKLDALKPELARTDGEEAIDRAHLEVQKERLAHLIETETAIRKKERILQVALGTAVLLLVLLFFLLYRKKQKARAFGYEKKVAFLQAEKLRSEKDLAEKENTLEAFKTYLNEKNRQITELEAMMSRFDTGSAARPEGKSDALHRLLESHLMTDENWQQFRRAFIKEREAEYQELMEQYPVISESGLRVLLLQKMGLSNSEAAHLLGITPGAVKKAKQRLRKKYEEPADTDL